MIKNIFILVLGLNQFFVAAQTEFITTWKTDNPGVSEDNQITIPTFPGEVYDYTVDWGDGTSNSGVTGDITHNYSLPGTYTVIISGDFPRIYFYNEGDKEKILAVEQWGDIKWKSMSDAFLGCKNLDVRAVDVPNLSNVFIMDDMFNQCSSLVGNPSMGNWDLSNVSIIGGMFSGASIFNQDIGNWNVSNVTNMAAMFSGAKTFNKDIGTWDVRKVTNMQSMFANAVVFNQDLNKWNVGNVVNMLFMFEHATSFNQPIGSWNVSRVINMQSMFYGASAFNQNIEYWNVGNVTDMSGMFIEAISFNKPIGKWNVAQVQEMDFMFLYAESFNQDIGDWNVQNVTNMQSMFRGANSFDQDISNWNVANVTDMSEMFKNAIKFDQPIGKWNVGSVSKMSSMFDSASNFDQDLSVWNVSHVNDMSFMFRGSTLSQQNYDLLLQGWNSLSSLMKNVHLDASSSKFCQGTEARQNLIDSHGWIIIDNGKSCPFITTWKTDNPRVSADNQITIPTFSGETYDYTVDWGDETTDTGVTGDITHTYANPGTYKVKIIGDFPRIYFNDFDGTLRDSDKIISVDQWGQGMWASMDNAFTHCSNLDVLATDMPNLEKTTSLVAMFRFCESLVGNPSFSDWQVRTINNFANMFDGASQFNQDIQVWDVTNVVNMTYMFSGATNFNSDISKWDIGNVEFLNGMFMNASSFNQPIGSWDVQNLTSMQALFAGASSFNQDISAWNVSKVQNMGGMFSGANSFNQDINSWDVRNVTNMNSMFSGATSFNSPLNSWDVSSVTDMSAMFDGTNSFNQSLSEWNVSNVTQMTSMFVNATSFDQSIKDWDVSNVTNMSGMFLGASSFNQDISGWNMGNVTSIGGMFNKAVSFDQNLGKWNISNVINMEHLFNGTGLSVENYDKTLIGWNDLQTLQSAVILSAGNSEYCEASEARQNIIDTYGWTISDAGESPLCNRDNDVDGVMDHKDDCLNTRPGVDVNGNGCEIIPNDAISVYVLTPNCIDSSDGSIEITMSASGYLLNISIEGQGVVNTFDNVASGTGFKIDNLPVGAYSVTVSIPEVHFSQTYGVTVNEVSSVSAKRVFLNSKSGSVSYSVLGSKSYEVSVNGKKTNYRFDHSGAQTIALKNLSGQNEIVISGESDCQGKITDSFFIGDAIQVFPTISAANVNLLTNGTRIKVRVFSMDGRMVKELTYDQEENNIDISSLKSGIYILRMSTGTQVETVKIVKK